MLGERLSEGTAITKGLYHFQGGNGNDSSGNANNGTGTNVTYSVRGPVGYGIETTGNGYFDVGDWYSGEASYTLMGWFNSDVTATSSDYNLIFRYSDSSGFDSFRAYYGGYGNNLIRWRWCSGSVTDTNNQLDITYSFSAGVWYHMAFVLNDTDKVPRFYLNGSLYSSGSAYTGSASKSTKASQKMSWLNRYYSANEGWDGRADELEMAIRALSANEIKKIYTYQKGRYGIL